MSSANTIINKRRPSAGSLCAALLAVMLLPACENNIKNTPSNAPRQQIPEESKYIESYLSEGAKVKGKLTAPYMLRYQKADTPYSEFPRTLHVDFYTDSLQIESQMDARYGKYLPNQNKVFLRDSVRVKNILKGDTLHCKYLWWDQQTQKFTTDDSVAIYTKDKILFGVGMEADQNFRWYTIKQFKGSILTSQNAMPSKL
jgi:LPS export ABC transporter protein LptC